MKTNEELTKLLEDCHPFLIHVLCTCPPDSQDYLKAKELCEELDKFLYPAVREAFRLDKIRQKRLKK